MQIYWHSVFRYAVNNDKVYIVDILNYACYLLLYTILYVINKHFPAVYYRH